MYSSPCSSLAHDPVLTLASNCVRDFFGPTVQTVADCLQSRGGSSTLTQIVSNIRSQCRREWNEERERLVINGHYKLHRARGPTSSGYVVEVAPIRAALIVLLQHGIVSVEYVDRHKRTLGYRYVPHRARLLPRYPRFVEYAKKALDEVAAALVEELLLNGKMRTVDAIVATVNRLQEQGEAVKSEKYTHRQSVVESFRRMVEAGFIEVAPPVLKEADEDEEYEFVDPSEEPSRKKQKAEEKSSVPSSTRSDIDDPAVVALLKGAPYKNVLPRDSIWHVNITMFHESIRAFCLGRLVAERYGHKVQSAGSMVTAALKLMAHKKHTSKSEDFGERHCFSPADILSYLPKPVQQALEKKTGGVIFNLSAALVELSRFTHPKVIEEIEATEGHPKGGKFALISHSMVTFLRERIHHQVLYDSHGEVAARICSILDRKGYLESDAVAELAMLPAKDTREILHKLYREKYVTLFTLQQSKQHNPATTLYLWTVKREHLGQTVLDNVCSALVNLRLRRQHEMEGGKDWIERAKEAGVTDENDHEVDKVNYQKFCQGLERIDNATLQLDETLTVLMDF